MLEVDPRVRIRDACCSRKHFYLGLLFYQSKDVFALAVILVGKRDNLGCIEKAVFFSHHYCFVVEFHLNTASAKIRYLDKD